MHTFTYTHTIGMWRALSHTGDEWKTVGVFEHLERLWALWKHGEGMSRSGRGGVRGSACYLGEPEP